MSSISPSNSNGFYVPDIPKEVEARIAKLPGMSDSEASEMMKNLRDSSRGQAMLNDRKITVELRGFENGETELEFVNKANLLPKVIFVALSILTGGLFFLASLVWNVPKDYLWGRTWSEKFANPTADTVKQVAQQAISSPDTTPVAIMPAVDNPQAISAFYSTITDEKLRSGLLRDGFLTHFEPDYAKAQAKPLDVGNYIVTNLSQDEIVKYGQLRPMAKFDFRYNNNGRETTFKVSYIDNRYSFDLNPFALSSTPQNWVGSCQHLNEIPRHVDAMLKKMKSIQS